MNQQAWVAEDAPDGPGWWAFEGSEWEQKKIGCLEEEADGYKESDWDEGDEPEGYYYKYVDTEGEPFRSVVEVKWVMPGMAISDRKHSGPHTGEPVLGFVSPKYRWNHALYAVDTLVGKWYRLRLPWETRE